MSRIDPDELQRLRSEYIGEPFRRHDLPEDPLVLFRRWFDAAVDSGAPQPNAMVLATSDRAGVPQARLVLLKSADRDGFSFFTNYTSSKARQLDACGIACLLFFWHELHRQVRIEGLVERVPEEESDAYFASRPRGAQIGAWASPQSQPLESREVLEQRVGEISARFADAEVPRPDHWGGYRLRPRSYEFWQGRENRLHDRFRYAAEEVGHGALWRLARLAP